LAVKFISLTSMTLPYMARKLSILVTPGLRIRDVTKMTFIPSQRPSHRTTVYDTISFARLITVYQLSLL